MEIDDGTITHLFELARTVRGRINRGKDLGTKGNLDPDLDILLDEIERLEKRWWKK